MNAKTVDVGEEIEPSRWLPLPGDDRLMVGGRTVWTGPYEVPVLVAQPNRWGQAEETFPDLPALVEVDPLVSGHLPMPHQVVGWVDRAHRPVAEPRKTPAGRQLISDTARLAKLLDQIAGVRLVAMPGARTVAFMTPSEPMDVVARCLDAGVIGLRTLDGLAGGIAVAVAPAHTRADLERIAEVLSRVARS